MKLALVITCLKSELELITNKINFLLLSHGDILFRGQDNLSTGSINYTTKYTWITKIDNQQSFEQIKKALKEEYKYNIVSCFYGVD